MLLFFITAICTAFVEFGMVKPKFFVPKGWPQPEYDFKKNPPSEKLFELGRQLFYDPILSRDSTISCSSCHLQATAFTHVDHDLSHGIDGKIGNRNSPVLINLAWSKLLMWDGAVNHIEVQALAPIENHLEMDETLKNVVLKLNRNKDYKSRFKACFKDSTISGPQLLKSIAQFLLQLNSYNSKYDKVKRKEKGVEFTSQEKKGYDLFLKHCNACHSEPLFTNHSFETNGLSTDTFLKDLGRMKITLNRSDSLKFKVPTLRNIQFSYPYMHDGRFRKLSEVLKHYSKGVITYSNSSSKLSKPLNLTADEQVDLISFLLTLTDKDFLFNPKFGYQKQ